MANLDRRIIPLLDMLTELGLDWLVFELVDGIRRSGDPEETATALSRAREQSRSGRVTRGSIGVEKSLEELAAPLSFNQLEWAASYIRDRFEECLMELTGALESIDALVDHEDPGRASKAITATVVLRDDDQSLAVTRAGLNQAKERLSNLKQALQDWLNSQRGPA